MRVDIRDNLIVAARAERAANGNSIVLISDVLVDELMGQEWTKPVQLAISRPESGHPVVEITVREIKR